MKCRQSTPDSKPGSPCLSGMVSKRLEFSLVLPLLLVIQWLHILAGITWFGGYLVLDVVLWPTLLRLPVKQAKMTSDLIGKFAGPVMATSGTLVVLLGIIRGTVLGPITSFSFLFGSSYGITWLVALVVSVILIIWGAGWHDRVIGSVWGEMA